MRIYYPAPEPFPDARARFLQIIHTAHALARAGADVRLLTGLKAGFNAERLLAFYGLAPHPNLTVTRLPLLRREEADRFRVSWHGVFHAALIAYLLGQRFTSRPPGLLFVRHLKLAARLLPVRRVLGLPLVYEVHEFFHLTADRPAAREKLKRLETAVHLNAEALICLTEHTRSRLKEIWGREQNVFVAPSAAPGEWLDREPGPPGSYILYTGALYAWKGVDTLIRAMKYLPGEKALIVGGGDRLDALKRLADREGVAERVEFTGPVAHQTVPAFLSQAKVAVLPNTAEGTSPFSSPLKLFEYLAAGLPVVASDIPAFRDVLQNGQNALLIEPSNPRALAEAVRRLTDNPALAETLSRQARQDAEHYTYPRRAETLLSVFKMVLENGKIE